METEPKKRGRAGGVAFMARDCRDVMRELNFINRRKEIKMDNKINRKLFGECLAHYAQREPKHFLQFDCFYMPGGGDSDMHPDENGDYTTANSTVELIHGSTVRVLIPHDTDPVVAVRQLKKIAKWLKREPMLIKELVINPMECERMEIERKHHEDQGIPF